MRICSKCNLEILDSHWWEWTQWDGYFHHNCIGPEFPTTKDLAEREDIEIRCDQCGAILRSYETVCEACGNDMGGEETATE